MASHGRRLGILGVVLLTCSTACQSFLDLEVQYQDCVTPESPYEEEFREGRQGLLDRCWQLEDPDGQAISVDAGDLVIRLAEPGQWTESEHAALALRPMDGDFLVAVRAEALDRVTADHCLPDTNLAGLVVRERGAVPRWATLLLGPYLDEPGVDCAEDSTSPPRARAEVRSFGWGADSVSGPPAFAIDGIGEDGEADLAFCRYGGELLAYTRDVAETDPAKAWDQIPGARIDVGTSAVDVGVTVNATPTAQPPELKAEGHFNWTVYVDELGADGCSGALETLTLPEGE